MSLETLNQRLAETEIKIFEGEYQDIVNFHSSHSGKADEENKAILSVMSRIVIEERYAESMTHNSIDQYNLMKQGIREYLKTHNSPNPFDPAGELFKICKEFMDPNPTSKIQHDCFLATDIQNVPTFLAETFDIAMSGSYDLAA